MRKNPGSGMASTGTDKRHRERVSSAWMALAGVGSEAHRNRLRLDRSGAGSRIRRPAGFIPTTPILPEAALRGSYRATSCSSPQHSAPCAIKTSFAHFTVVVWYVADGPVVFKRIYTGQIHRSACSAKTAWFPSLLNCSLTTSLLYCVQHRAGAMHESLNTLVEHPLRRVKA